MSKDPIPKERAEAQRRALYASERKTGGGPEEIANRLSEKHLSGGVKTKREKVLEMYNLEDKPYSLEELSKHTAVPLNILQEVFNRGVGAHKTQGKSVRLKHSFVKNVDAPMSKKLSADQWGYARVYSFISGNPKHDNDLRTNKLSGGIIPKEWFLKRQAVGAFPKDWTYEDYVKSETSQSERLDAERKALAQKNAEYQARVEANPDLADVYCDITADLQPKKRAEIVSRATCRQRHMDYQDKLNPANKVFRPIVKGLTSIADEATQFTGSLPGIGKVATEVYKGFAPPGSKFYKGAGDDLEGAGFFGDVWDAGTKAVKKVVQRVKDVAKGVRLDYAPSIRALLPKIGNLPIVGMFVRRDPIRATLNTALNLITLGKWNEVRRKYNYDKLFHQSLEVVLTMEDGKLARYMIEKNEVISITPAKATDEDTQMLEVPLGKPLTINQLLEGGKQVLGPNFFTYEAFGNNCGHFILALLKGSGLLTPAIEAFVSQPMEQVAAELPSYAKKFAKFTTDTAAIANVALHGRGGLRPSEAFERQLKNLGISPKKYLATARRKAKALGLAHTYLGFSDDETHKLQIPNADGRIIRFGKAGMGDHILYTLAKDPSADTHRRLYRARAEKIRGDWKSDPYSPNSLAIGVLW